MVRPSHSLHLSSQGTESDAGVNQDAVATTHSRARERA
jgi:hypothetical protein